MFSRLPTVAPTLLVLLSSLFAAPACGKAKDALSNAKDGIKDTATNAVEAVDDWINKEPMEQRRARCAQEGGTWVEKVKISACEAGQTELSFDGVTQVQSCDAGEGGEADDQCVHTNEDGLSYFNDGPSVPHLLQRLSSSISGDIDQLRYLDLFWPAGVNHDYCYHHGASVYGLDQTECDSQYFSDLSAVCANESFRQDNPWFKQRSCRQVAATHYAAVRAQGEGAYNTLQSFVTYPAWVPLWQQFGMAEDVIDQEMADEIDEKLGMLGLLPTTD